VYGDYLENGGRCLFFRYTLPFAWIDSDNRLEDILIEIPTRYLQNLSLEKLTSLIFYVETCSA